MFLQNSSRLALSRKSGPTFLEMSSPTTLFDMAIPNYSLLVLSSRSKISSCTLVSDLWSISMRGSDWIFLVTIVSRDGTVPGTQYALNKCLSDIFID